MPDPSRSAFESERNLEPDAALDYQAAHESQVRSYPRRLPLAIERAKGPWVWDTRGQKYLDFLSGAGVMALGHHHPEVDAEIINQINRQLPYQTLDLTSPVKNAFIEELLDFLPDGFSDEPRVQFCGPSGADAVEAALKLAKLKTGRTGIFSFQGGYHGVTHGALAVTGNLAMRERQTGLMPDVHFLPYPYSFRCPFGIGGADGARVGLNYLETILNDRESGIAKPAAIILEAIQGEGGVIPAPRFWLRELRRITREHGIVLIMDEIQSGIGRTGAGFAHEASGISPDILVLSKAVGGGLPLAVLVFDASMDAWRGGEHCGTFRGNQLAMAAGAKTLQIIRRDGLCGHAKAMGKRLMKGLKEIAKNAPDCVGEVRGRGLMVGMEIVDRTSGKPGCPPPHGAERAVLIQREALKRGLIIERGGRHGCVLRFLPPLIIKRAQIDRSLATIADSINASAT
jgi:diaminobutyrate-2-oxoglutarate transaminase